MGNIDEPAQEVLSLTLDKKVRFSAKYFVWPVCNLRWVSERIMIFLVSISLMKNIGESGVKKVFVVFSHQRLYFAYDVGPWKQVEEE